MSDLNIEAGATTPIPIEDMDNHEIQEMLDQLEEKLRLVQSALEQAEDEKRVAVADAIVKERKRCLSYLDGVQIAKGETTIQRMLEEAVSRISCSYPTLHSGMNASNPNPRWWEVSLLIPQDPVDESTASHGLFLEMMRRWVAAIVSSELEGEVAKTRRAEDEVGRLKGRIEIYQASLTTFESQIEQSNIQWEATLLQAVAMEREECAKLTTHLQQVYGSPTDCLVLSKVAEAIRARGGKR